MTSFRDLIDSFTVKTLAEALGVAESHVRTMRARDSIPPEYWPALVSNAPDDLKSVLTFDHLIAMRKAAISRKSEGASQARP